MSYQKVVKSFPRGKNNYPKLLMNLKQLITPKNEDGSIDHRYIPIAQSIVDLAGKRVESDLRKLYDATNNLEKESASAGLQLVIALFGIPMDERFERSKFKKHIREQLQEIGFKPSKVSKLMGAGEFYARLHGTTYTEFEYFSASELIEMQNRFLNEYFKNVSKLYELSRMSEVAVFHVRNEFLNKDKIYTLAELEDKRRSNPKEEHKRRARKRSSHNFSKNHLTHQVAAHESLEVMEDADEECVIKHPESAQSLIGHFLKFVASGAMEQRLAEYAPAAQAHLIDEINVGIHLLEEFVAKYKTIEVTHVH